MIPFNISCGDCFTCGPIKVSEGSPDDLFVYLSDVLPTAWQAVEYANIAEGETVPVLGLGPIGEMASRIAQHRGAGRVIGVDDFATHHLPLEEAPLAYEIFQKKEDNAFKTLLKP